LKRYRIFVKRRRGELTYLLSTGFLVLARYIAERVACNSTFDRVEVRDTKSGKMVFYSQVVAGGDVQ
jgi:hypothetical protein